MSVSAEPVGEPLDPSEWVWIELVPTEVFGAGPCPDHDTDADCLNCRAYGLSDAVSAWSDCNRAQMYRVEDLGELGAYRDAGDTLKVLARRSDLPWFAKRFGST